MSYTITQQATTPNAAYTRLLYTVSGSTNTASPQFQYVMDVYESGSSTLIKRTTQTINPAGVATFDPSRIMQGQLSEDNSWKISSVTAFDSSSKVFTLEFGEMYAASISSSAVTIEGIASTNTEVFRGVVEPNAGYFNWDSASYAVLSNMPATMSMQTNDYGTVSVYNNDVSYVSQSFYSASSTTGTYDLVEQKNYSVTNNFSSVPISGSTPYWNYVDVSVSSSLGLEEYRYEASDETHREKTRFAFINKLGAWDYYNNYNPVRQAIDVKREQYTAPRVDYSSLTSTYDISRRGLKDYHNSTDDTFTVDTDLLDKTNANWLEELIESPSVYIQRNGEFIPIVITDSSYTANTNQARQKQFQYTINFKPSNQPFGTWIPEYVECPKKLGGTFDPTLNGEISPYFWFDFTDTGSMIISSSNNEIYAVQSKGTNTGYIAKGGGFSATKYDSANYSPPIWKGKYTQFNNNPLGKHSTLSRLYDTGSVKGIPVGNYPILTGSGGIGDTVFNTGSASTTILFTNPIYNEPSAGYKGYSEVISYKATQPNNSNAEETTYLGVRIIDTGGNTGLFNYYSTATSSISNSIIEYEDLIPNTRQKAGYSYNNSAGGWQSNYVVYNSGSSNTIKIGRDTKSSQEFTTGSIVFKSVLPSNTDQEELAIGSRAFMSSGYTNRYPFNISHFIIYEDILTDSQIETVINSYTFSDNSVPINTFEN